MIAELLAAAAAFAPAYTATTDERRRLTLTVRGNRIARVTTTVADYECETFGQIGPLRVRVAPAARIDRRGRFSFVTGSRAERIGVAGTLRSGARVTGRIRVSGTIATGQRCTSPVIRFRTQR